MIKYECMICGSKLEGIKIHLRKKHQLSEEEYFLKFPEEKDFYERYRKEVVFPLLQERSPNSIKFYIKKGFSEEESIIELQKYNANNPFRKKENAACNKEYWIKKGYLEDEIPELIRKTVSSSEENLIERHGEEIGKLKYEKWYNSLLDRSETELKNICSSQDVNLEDAIFIRNKRKGKCSPRTIDYWKDKGYDEETSIILQKKYQGSSVEKFFINKINEGNSFEEAKELLRSKVDSCSIDAIKKRYNCPLEDAIEFQYEIINKRFNTRIENGISVPLEKRTEMENYYFRVWQATNSSWKIYRNFINSNGNNRGINFHLDHKFSILQGFKNNIEPEIIGSCINLEIIPAKENCAKQSNCSISKEELFNQYEKFINNENRIVYV